MTETPQKTLWDLKNQYSPDINPLVEGIQVKTKRGWGRTARVNEITDSETGEIMQRTVVHHVVEKDEAEFVKVFSDGVKAAFDLDAAAAKVFTSILKVYQETPMRGGYADTIYLAWFNDGLNGHAIGIKERTFQRGLKELLSKGFLAPKLPNEYWVNPALFFKGDRVIFMKEYRRKRVLNDQKELESNIDKLEKEYLPRQQSTELSQEVQDALLSWNEYEQTGLHVTWDETKSWMNSWFTDNEQLAPVCHK